ncbi:hypothetical protein [Paraburkholderia sediminicola]|uniref:hypothetical protein n=1 Tax=Paraburkholderia sediminicola TaxID=458836 RepID=UPI0038B78EE7
MQCKFGVFAAYLSQLVTLTLVLFPTRMKQVYGFKCGTDETVIFFAEVVSYRRYAGTKVIFERFPISREVEQPPSANYRAKIPALVHN